MEAKLILDNHKIVSWNELYSSPHWRVRKKTADDIHQLVKFEALGQEIPTFNKKVKITITASKESHAIDCDNVCAKLYIDGLVGAGVIVNDSPKYVSCVTTRSLKGNVNHVDIEIESE